MEIRASVVGDKQVAEALQRAPREVGAEVARAINWGTTKIANTAKQDHPYTDRTANLTNSIGIIPARQAIGNVVGIAQAVMAYAEAVEEGTPPHGDHPGSAPHPFMGPAKDKHYDDIVRRIEAGADRGLRRTGL